jgi:phosphoglycerate-specific signal transduction histidine kinase
MLAIAVGWLSQQLHDYYERLVSAERLAAVGQVAVTLHHELGNALQAITAEVGALQAGGGLSEADRASIVAILDMSRRIQEDVKRIASLTEATTTSYVGETKMVNLKADG